MFLHKTNWLKFQRRAGLIAINSLHKGLPMLLTPLVSLLVIRQASVAVWGTFVAVLIMVQLGTHLVAWGNDTYLLREFSRHPAGMAAAWQSSLRTRLALFVGLALLALLLYPQAAGWIILWGLALVLHQSCAVLVTYRRDFLLAALVELAGSVVLLTAVFLAGEAITPDWLLRLFALTTLAKTAVLLLRYGDVVASGNGRFQPRYFRLALPFFLLGLGGMLSSRADLYIIAFYFPAEEVGIYQVFSSFLLYIQALAGFILLPFVKTIYRLPYRAIRQIARALFSLGCLIVPLAMIALAFLLDRLYGIALPPAFFWLGGLAALPIFYASPLIYGLFKAEKQTTVLQVNLVGILTTLVLNLILLPRVGLIGAVIAMVVMKWLVLFIYQWHSGLQSAHLQSIEK
jgi:O-antigen/teichoic acid export membrane protein